MELNELLYFSLQSSWALPDPHWGVICSITFVHLCDSQCAKLDCRRDPNYKDLDSVSHIVFLGGLV